MKILFKFVLCGLVVLLNNFSSLAQAEFNSSARVFLNKSTNISNYSDCDYFNQIINDYDLIGINGNYYIGVLALVEENLIDRNHLKQLGVINDTRLNQLWTMRVPVDNFAELQKVQGVKYFEIGEPVSPFLETAIPSARVDSVHLGLGNLETAYNGKGVIVAIIDWGFDYTHPNFYDTTLTQLRLSRAWDQNKLSGPHPNGYSFGTEYVGKNALLNAGSDTLYVFGPMSHGTHVAGIAGGSGAGTVHRGAAYESELIFISLRRDAPSLIDAFSYVANYAASVNKPFVINMSFGSHLGPHDGTSLKNLGIDILHGPGKIFVGSAGNNGTPSVTFHLDNDFSTTPGDTLMTVVGFVNIPDMFGQTLSMWGSEFSDFSVALRLVNLNDSLLHETLYYSSLTEPQINDTILVGGDSLIIRIQSTAKHFLNNKPNIRLEVKKTGANKLVLLATSNNSHLHIWNNVRMNSRYTNWGVPLSSNYPGSIGGDNNYGLGEPAGVGRNVITVASYRAERTLINGNIVLGHLSSFSSKGPTVDNRTKPDIASTGEAVISSVNSFDYSITDYHTTVDFNGIDYGFVSFSGTSMSAPMVSGIVALMLEAFPEMSATQVKEVLKETARLDNNTGNIDHNGHLQWGWGKANALAAVKAAEVLSNVNNIYFDNVFFNIYPNPVKNYFNIEIDESVDGEIQIDIFSIDGKLVKSINETYLSPYVVKISDMTSGIYVVKVQTTNKFGLKKLIILD